MNRPVPGGAPAGAAAPLIRLDKTASVTRALGLPRTVELTGEIPAREGVAVAVRALDQKEIYGELELVSGRQAKILKGDVLVGVLGSRRALKGFVGRLPAAVVPGDTLHVLNRGGVIGEWIGGHCADGSPLRAEVLGAVVRRGRPLCLLDNSLPWLDRFPAGPPLVVVSGTCMQAGKTTVAAALIGWLTRAGLRVGAAKLTGVACRRDILNMEDHGAIAALSFLEAGLPSTSLSHERLPDMAKGVLAALGRERPNVIVVEMGDGLIGGYGSDCILSDPEIRARIAFHLLCANDVAGAYGASAFARSIGLSVEGFSGPATDNAAGTDCLRDFAGLPSFNVRTGVEALGRAVLERVGRGVRA